MNRNFFAAPLAAFLIITLIAPSAFLAVPQRVQAALPVFETNPILIGEEPIAIAKTAVESTITAFKSTISAALDVTNTAANVAMKINALVLQPLAFVLSGNLMKMLTAGVIQFVIGKANGTGIPQFVTDVQKSLQTVSDSRALAFFDQFGRNSNSPFAAAISSSLRNDYLSKTSLAGFWAVNMNTLARSTPSYAPGYLAGNWSQGGIAAWFALTTQTENNPYTLYQASQSQLAGLVGPGVGGATGARIAELGWGNGFMSWCGDIGNSYSPNTPGSGANPGDPCTDKDGNPRTIKTPGSVIVATLNKVLGGQQDQILRMGNVGPEINAILNNVATVVQTANFAAQVLGGVGSGGLFGIDKTSGSSATSPLRQFAPTQTPSGNFTSGYLGVTNSGIYQNAAASPESGPDMLSRVSQYESAWNTIKASAETASTSVRTLASFCTNEAKKAKNDSMLASFVQDSTAQAAAAEKAITDTIAPVFTKASVAAVTAATARAMVQRVQSELNSATADAATSNYMNDVQTLQNLPPTITDVANAQQDAQTFGSAQASPPNSLSVSGSSLIDQMNLIGTNAAALKASVCTPPESTATPVFQNSGP